MILFPTRGRDWALTRFIEQYALTGATLPVCVIIDTDNGAHYEKALDNMPDNFELFINKTSKDLRAAVNNAFAFFPDEPFYCIIADDIVPKTYEWDVKLAEAAGKHNIAWGDDGIWGERLCTHPAIGGDLVRAWGWFMSPYTNRHCADFIWKDFADALGIGVYRDDIKLPHLHWQAGQAKYDVTYATQPSPQEGHKQYHDIYKGSEQFKKDVAMVREKLGI